MTETLQTATGTAQQLPQQRSGPLSTVRRLIVVILLFSMVVIAAIGVTGLLERAFESGSALAGSDASGLARSLAFTLIAGPLAALLWWFVWKSLRDHRERSSVSWALYLTAMCSLALITSASTLLATLASLVGGYWLPDNLAIAIAWLLVWVWHVWMTRHPAKRPTRLVGVPWVIGSVFGLALFVGGSITALSQVLDTALSGAAQIATFGRPWWHAVATGLIWAAGGAVVWWWHWFVTNARSLRSGFAALALVLVTGLGGMVLALGGLATALYIALRLGFDRGESVLVVLEPAGTAIAAAAVGAVVLAYYQGVVERSTLGTRRANRLVASGVALAGAATGVGIIVNSALAAVSTPLAGSGPLTLLLAGVSALAVGGPAWWLIWRPTAPVDPTDSGRRVYLAVVFGISAVVALITLLVLAFRILESTLDSGVAAGLLEQVRAPLGLLLATVLVAAYHFAIWRRERPEPSVASGPPDVQVSDAQGLAGAEPRSLGEVILVIGSDPEPYVRAIQSATGATVTVWQREDALGSTVSPDDVVHALAGASAPRALITVGSEGALDVIYLSH
ncbi:DUF5671 domain-containing protein [Homoserinimonas sp. OAct 916]|uniref:DUF5671 domain-containing protein n=1 Tax=Homoserinimonas sp. OAct 916 TaxID=2211450 RepID=UPI001E41D341|nr:DUF5671 domain-containing protein [Homoserinimonas sp. OAct 916]